MYIPAAEMGEYDSWKPPPQKRTSSRQVMEGSLQRQSSSQRFSGVERTSSRGRMEMTGDRTRLERQDSRAQVSRQSSRSKMTPGRQGSQRELVRQESSHTCGHDAGHSHDHHQSDVERQIRMLASSNKAKEEGKMIRQGSRNKMTPGSQGSHSHNHGHDHGHDHSHSHGQSDVERQIRMLASSSKSREGGKVVRDTYQANTKQGWQNSLRGSAPDPAPRRSEPRLERGGSRGRVERKVEEERRRSSRSESGSPAGRLLASTCSSRAKKSDPFIEEESPLKRRSSRTSKSPQRSRSRANSASQDRARRRSQSNTRPSPGAAPHYEDLQPEDTDPFLTYRSFKQFQDEEANSGSLRRERAKPTGASTAAKTSSSYSERSLSSSLSAAKISSPGYDSPLSSLSSENRPSLGMFSSTPKYPDYSMESGLARQSSSSIFSNGDSGYSASSSSFSSFNSSSMRRSSGVFSSDTGAGGKISLGSLKKPSTDNSNSGLLRRGVSSTYIG